MRQTVKRTIFGNITIEHQKWHQGRLVDHMVMVYKDNYLIFEEEDMSRLKATVLYNEKIKEYQDIGNTNYVITVKNVNRKWTEKYSILSSLDSQLYFTNMIKKFNDTLRQNEKERTLISVDINVKEETK